MTTVDRSLQSIRPTLHVLLRPQGQSICAQEDFIINFHVYVCSRRYKVYVLTKILLTFKCICAQEDFINFINFKCICAQEDYTFYQKFLGVPTLGVNTETRRRRFS